MRSGVTRSGLPDPSSSEQRPYLAVTALLGVSCSEVTRSPMLWHSARSSWPSPVRDPNPARSHRARTVALAPVIGRDPRRPDRIGQHGQKSCAVDLHETRRQQCRMVVSPPTSAAYLSAARGPAERWLPGRTNVRQVRWAQRLIRLALVSCCHGLSPETWINARSHRSVLCAMVGHPRSRSPARS
jgi:hypothetical protein